MPLVIENAWWAMGAAVIAVAVAILWVARGGRSRRWRVVCVGLPGMAAVFLALAMAGLGVVWGPRAGRVVVLLDLSESTRGDAWRDPGWVRELAMARLGGSEVVTVVGFGGSGGPRVLVEDVRVDAEGKWPRVWAEKDLGSGEGSDVAGALAWRSGAEVRGEVAVAPRWVVTDGYVEGAEVVGAQKFAVGWTGLPPGDVDVGVVEVEVHGVKDGAEILARVGATGKAEAEVEVFRDGKEIDRQRVLFAGAGSRWMSVRDLGAGSAGHHYEVVAERVSGGKDRWGEDDRGEAEWVPENEAARVLIVGGEEGLDGLKGFRRGVVSAGRFPSDAGRLVAEGWQVVVLNDVPAMVLPGEKAPAGGVLPGYAGKVLDEFVRESGGGVLIVGRERAFGAGHYAEAGVGKGTLEGLSPVSSERQDRPPATVVFLLDGSGSMNEAAGGPGGAGAEQKFRLAVRGAEQAMELLQDQDQVAVIVFNDEAKVIAAGTKGELLKNDGGENVLRRKLDEVKPTGSTVPDVALEEIARAAGVRETDAKKASPKMVVLLTDGEIPAMEVEKWKGMLAATGSGFVVVAPEPEKGSDLRRLAAEVKGTWLAAEDAGVWAMMLKRAVAERMMGEAKAGPMGWRTVEGMELRGVAGEWIEVWKKGEAQETVVSEDGKWVLGAEVQRGLGKVAAVAMGAGEDAGNYDRLMERTIAGIAGAAGDRRFTVAARREGENWVVTADGVDGGKFLDGIDLRFRSFDAGGGAGQVVEMRQVGAGKYEGRVRSGAGLVGVVVREGEGGEKLVGRVREGRTAGREWPASFDAAPVVAPAGAEVLSGDLNAREMWRPRLRGVRVSLAEWFWIGAAVAGVAALWLRRGGSSRLKSVAVVES